MCIKTSENAKTKSLHHVYPEITFNTLSSGAILVLYVYSPLDLIHVQSGCLSFGFYSHNNENKDLIYG